MNLTLESLEAIFQTFHEIKKCLHYDKHSGTWTWADRDEPGITHGQFPTALDAMRDAVDPYFSS